MARSRNPAQRRAARLERRNTGSDLGARVIVGVPAAIAAVVLIYSSNTVFAVGALILGMLALGELFNMYPRVRPVRLAGFLALIGMAAAARFGGEHAVLLAAVATFPVMFLVAALTPGGPSTTARMSLTVLGVFWVGFAIAHA
ncbi:MAG TPA: hypothetical protein VM266_14160, partial [Solirubrobacteraceae bacterium]|nr:hypothetical protein [Solirubrobacteraceae bacterium]